MKNLQSFNQLRAEFVHRIDPQQGLLGQLVPSWKSERLTGTRSKDEVVGFVIIKHVSNSLIQPVV
jgi:hypothetical protein